MADIMFGSYKELGMLMLVVIMGMLIFSGMAYVGEKDVQGTMFDFMPTVSSYREVPKLTLYVCRPCTGPSSLWPQLDTEISIRLLGLENWWDQVRVKDNFSASNFYLSSLCPLWCSLYIPSYTHHCQQFQQILWKVKDWRWNSAQEDNIIMGRGKAR